VTLDLDELERRIGSEFDNEATLMGDELRALIARVRELEAGLVEAYDIAKRTFDVRHMTKVEAERLDSLLALAKGER
jgi:hypothetical protein